MSIPVACQCGQQFDAKLELAGKTVKCPSCGQPLVIPAVNPQFQSQPNPLANQGNVVQQLQMQMGGFPNQAGLQSQLGQPRPAKRRVNWKIPLFIGIGVVAAGVVVTVTVLVINAVGKMSDDTPKYNSPEEVAKAYYQAQIEKDVEALYYTLTPEARQRLIAGRILVLVEMANNPNHANVVYAAKMKGIDLSDIPERCAKYGIDLSEFPRTTFETMTVADFERAYEIAGKINNPIGFLRECQELPGLVVALTHRTELPVIQNVTITGDTATADVKFRELKEPGKGRFRRVDDSWRFDVGGYFKGYLDRLKQQVE